MSQATALATKRMKKANFVTRLTKTRKQRINWADIELTFIQFYSASHLIVFYGIQEQAPLDLLLNPSLEVQYNE